MFASLKMAIPQKEIPATCLRPCSKSETGRSDVGHVMTKARTSTKIIINKKSVVPNFDVSQLFLKTHKLTLRKTNEQRANSRTRIQDTHLQSHFKFRIVETVFAFVRKARTFLMPIHTLPLTFCLLFSLVLFLNVHSISRKREQFHVVLSRPKLVLSHAGRRRPLAEIREGGDHLSGTLSSSKGAQEFNFLYPIRFFMFLCFRWSQYWLFSLLFSTLSCRPSSYLSHTSLAFFLLIISSHVCVFYVSDRRT